MNLAAALGASLMLVSTSGFADPTQSALPAGQPAGVRQAQNTESEVIYATIGLAVLGIVVGLAASSDSTSAANTAAAPSQP
jgi:hypothetical protein